MRKEFSAWMEAQGAADPQSVFLTGDLGFMALENVRQAMGARFVNAGVSEQNLISVAAGLAQQGLKPFCYSIAPFIVFRPAEQIRLDVCLHNLNVKIIGNGGGYGYGIMGATHHALEDLAVLSSFAHMRCYVPVSNEDVAGACRAMVTHAGPAYLRLGFGKTPEGIKLPLFAPLRRLLRGNECTVVGLGPVLLNVLAACTESKIQADVFAVAEIPVDHWGTELAESLRRTQKLLVVEEHVARGGLGEYLATYIVQQRLNPVWVHRHAQGYPQHRYGSQHYHQQQAGLDAASLAQTLRELVHG